MQTNYEGYVIYDTDHNLYMGAFDDWAYEWVSELRYAEIFKSLKEAREIAGWPHKMWTVIKVRISIVEESCD